MTGLGRLAAGMIVWWVVGCAPVPPRAEAVPAPVWPAAPEPARLAYVQSFERPDDLGIAKSFFTRLRDFLFGAEEARLIRPMAVVETGSALYVADPGARGVHRFDTREGGGYRLLQQKDGAPLPSPVALTRRGDTVYVTDSALAQVFVATPGAEFVVPLALEAEFEQPTGIVFDEAAGELFVVDTKRHCIRVFATDGRLQRTLGQRGTGPGEFNYPTLLSQTADGRLLLTDALNFRIQILDREGRVLGGFGRLGDGSGDTVRHKGVAVDRFGHVYVVDALFHALQIFDTAGQFLLSIGGQGQAPGEFWLPAGIFIGRDDRIYVADTYNRRVQVFRYVGEGP